MCLARHRQGLACLVALLGLVAGTARAEPTLGFGRSTLLAGFIPLDASLNLDGDTGYRAEFSGACFHPATGELLVVLRGDVSTQHAIQFYTPAGDYTRHVRLTGFTDLEGICIVDPASNRVAVVEEALNAITILTLDPAATNLTKASGRTLSMGLGPLGNTGIEGIDWDAARNCFYAIKEWQPLAIYRVTDTGTGAVTEILFDAPAALGALCTDLSDLHYDPVTDHLLILSDESQVVVETDLAGNIVDTLPVALTQPEGLALAASRRELYAIGEPNHFQRWGPGLTLQMTEGSSLLIPLATSEPLAGGATATVEVVLTSGTAVAGADATAASPVVVTAMATGAVEVLAPEDLDLEGPEYLYLSLTNAVGATLADDVSAVITIHDPGGFTATVTTAGIGIPFRAAITAIATDGTPLSNFSGQASLSVEGDVSGPDSLLAGDTSFTLVSGMTLTRTTRGLRFTPARDLTITALRYLWGDAISLWTDAGDLLASGEGPYSRGTWQTLPLTPPLNLSTGQVYRLASVRRSSGSFPYYVGTRPFPLAGPAVTILSGCGAMGDAFPAIVTNADYAVDLVYLGTIPATETVSPAVAGPFVDGHWAGWLTLTTAINNARLVVRDAVGHSGTSPRFTATDWPGVQLAVMPTRVGETTGIARGIGEVSLSTNGWETAREVRLYSDREDLVVPPASVTIAAFATNATFDLMLLDNAHPESPQPVSLQATHPGHATGATTLTVIDAESRRGLLLRVTQTTPRQAVGH